MGLKDIYAAMQAPSSETARDAKRFEEDVLPVVRQLAAEINADPDMSVTFSIAGDDGGFYGRAERGDGHSSYWWALQAQFSDKQGNDMGKAMLRLAGNAPQFMMGGWLNLNEPCNRQKAIKSLVEDASRYVATAESNRRLAAEVSAMNQRL